MDSPAPRRPGRTPPRLMLLRFGYFLERELMAAFTLAGAEVVPFRPEREAGPGGRGYAAALLERMREVRPDVLFSVNFLGGDFEGPLMELLRRLGVTFATWFVDSPELFLHGRGRLADAKPFLFCCDPDAEAKLAPLGFDRIHHLPLAADATRFDLENDPPLAEPTWPVGFVGSSWADKLGQALVNFRFPRELLRHYRAAGRALADGDYTGTTLDRLREQAPEFAAALAALGPEDRRGALHLACWEGNRVYRLDRVSRLAGTEAAVVGDAHWNRLLRPWHEGFTLHPRVGYYTPDLARLYRGTGVNFSCSGVQMPGAVTQRAFDVPSAGGFLLTDRRRQMDALFEPGAESASYDSPEEIPEAVARWTRDRDRARTVVRAARRRIAAEHTYTHRARRILEILAEH